MNDVQIAVRLPEAMVRRLDRIASRMSKEKPGVRVTRASVIRMFVLAGIDRAKPDGVPTAP